MWAIFNNQGKLLSTWTGDERSSARTGTTDFEIFGVFLGVDETKSGSASIRLIKPDLESSVYPLFGMEATKKTFSGSNNEYLTKGTSYSGFIFQFDGFADGQDAVKLLDTVGLWSATIILYSTSGGTMSVQGTVTFNVEKGDYSSPDGTDATIDNVTASLEKEIAALIPKTSDLYFRVSLDIPTTSDNFLPSDSDTRPAVVYCVNTRKFYQYDKANKKFVEISFDFASAMIGELTATTINSISFDGNNVVVNGTVSDSDGKLATESFVTEKTSFLPSFPNETGSYMLVCTVDDDLVPSLSWVKQI